MQRHHMTPPGNRCGQCQRGILQLEKGGQYRTTSTNILVNDVPQLKCSECGQVSYDLQLLTLIEQAITKEAQKRKLPNKIDFVHLGIAIPFPIR